MSEDAGATTQDAATAPESAAQDGNPLFRTKETVQAQQAPKADGKDAESMLADATADSGDDDPLAKAQAEITRWKTQARDNEKRAKLNADKAKNFDAYEESQKTEQQKLADQLAAAQEDVRKERGSRLRLLAAANYDLPTALIDHLGDGDEDEINGRAEAFAAAINERAAILAAAQQQAAAQETQQQQRPANGGFRPVESLRPGALPASDNKPADPNSWFRGMLANSKQRQ